MAACFAGALFGCGASADGGPAGDQQGESGLETTEQDINGGGLTSAFQYVFKLVTGTAACTATKIGQFKFLTAAHCFENSPNDTTVDVTSAANGTSNTVHLNITGGVRIHPSALLQNISPTTDDNYDIAVFSTSTATSGNPVTLDSTAEVLPVPTQAFFIGYGEDAIDPTHDGKKQSASLELNQEKPLVVTVKLAPGVTGPVGNHGDSGGPLFRASDFVFLGVTS